MDLSCLEKDNGCLNVSSTAAIHHQMHNNHHSKGPDVCLSVTNFSTVWSGFVSQKYNNSTAGAGENGFLKRPGMVDEFDQQVPSTDGVYTVHICSSCNLYVPRLY